jgi:hypothetical protein
VLVFLAGCNTPFGGLTGPGDGGRASTYGVPETPTATPATTPATTPTATPTTASTDGTVEGADSIGVEGSLEGGDVALDPDRVFDRVRSLLKTDAASPEVVRIVSEARTTTTVATPAPLFQLGVDPGITSFTGTAVSGDEVVVSDSQYAGPGDVETALARGFARTVQIREDARSSVERALSSGSTDAERTVESVVDGAALYVETAYWRRYVGTGESPANESWRRYRTVESPTELYASAPAAFGQRYVAGRVDAPTNLSTVYENPPRTTEAVIHGYAPGAERPVPLSVEANGDAWFPISDPDRLGELSVRLVVRTATNDSVAAAAADGWGNDRAIEFAGRTGDGFAWVLRWDDAENATEFATHFRTYLENRGNRTGGLWVDDTGTTFRFVRTSERTTAVLFGDREFVRNATVEGDSDVTVTTP